MKTSERKYTVEVHPPRLETETKIVEVTCQYRHAGHWNAFKRLRFREENNELHLIEREDIPLTDKVLHFDRVASKLLRDGHTERVLDQNGDLIAEIQPGSEYSIPDGEGDFYHRPIEFEEYEPRTRNESVIVEANVMSSKGTPGRRRTCYSARFRRDDDTLRLAEIVNVDAKPFENLEITTVAISALEQGIARAVYDEEGELVLEYRFGERYCNEGNGDS